MTKKIEILVKEVVNHPDINEENPDKEALERLTGWIHNSHFTDYKLNDKCINDITVDIGENKDWSISDYLEDRRVTIEGDVYLDAITGEYYDDKKTQNKTRCTKTERWIQILPEKYFKTATSSCDCSN